MFVTGALREPPFSPGMRFFCRDFTVRWDGWTQSHSCPEITLRFIFCHRWHFLRSWTTHLTLYDDGMMYG
jgi:hypothetical protein